MKYLSILLCICCIFCSATGLAADSDKEKLKKAYSNYQNLFNQNQYKESLPYAEEAFKLSKKVSGEKSKTTATLSHNYGINLLRAHKNKLAENVLSDTLVLYKEIYGSDAQELIGLYIDLGEARRSVDYQSSWYRTDSDALSIAKKVYGKDSASYGMLMIDLGHIELVNQAPFGESRIETGYKILQNLDISPLEMSHAEFIMGKLDLANHSFNSARKHLEAALIPFNEDGADKNLEQTIRAFLVEALENLGESELATDHVLAIGRMQAEAGISSFKPLFIKKPKFPPGVISQQTGTRIDVEDGQEGMVTLGFDVDEKGFTRNIEIKLLVGPDDYVKPAKDAVEKFRFAPRFVDGKPVVVMDLRYTFRFLL